MVNKKFLCNVTVKPTTQAASVLISFNGTSPIEYYSIGNYYSVPFNFSTPGIYMITVAIKNTNFTNSSFIEILAGIIKKIFDKIYLLLVM